MKVIERSQNDPPISLDQAKLHLRVDHDTDNDLITRLIASARDEAEQYLWRALITQTRELTLPGFFDDVYRFREPGRITLWGGLVSGVVWVKYLDINGTEQTVDSSIYRLVNPGCDHLAYLVPRISKLWPIPASVPGSVTVQYEVGYGDALPASTPVPAAIIAAMLLHIGWHYENREAPDSADFKRAWERLLAPFRLAP